MPNEIRMVSPTGSYLIDIPSDVQEDIDDRVVSYWETGDDILLQLSSYRRGGDEQVSASQRLQARLVRGQPKVVNSEPFALSECPDVASAIVEDDEGVYWLYVYAVWDDLTIFATISAGALDALKSSWALSSLRSLRRRRSRSDP